MSFPGRIALRGVSLFVEAGEIVVLLGPSGCGKTTLLRLIAGLEQPDSGNIFWDGQDLAEIPIHLRGFGMVFQDYALFPHKNVSENVRFGLRMHDWTEADQERRLAEVLDLVGLTGFADRAVYDLSGGEQQRVALARSLAPAPQLLLLDEPLGALDRALRERLLGELRDILKKAGNQREGMTAIYVTHDQEEAFAIADRVVVMNEGLVEQVATPQALYHQPATAFVAHFLGMENIFSGRILQRDPLLIETAVGLLPSLDEPAEDTERVQILIRPDACEVIPDRVVGLGIISGRVAATSFRGRFQQVTVRCAEPECQISFELTQTDLALAPDDPITIEIKAEGVCLLAESPPDKPG